MKTKWWKEAVGYEIYCKSFCDSNGDGIGDLQGVISKLPVLKELGVTCLWFTPIYSSPQVDNGYDVSDYQNIDPDYGTLDDFRELLNKAHSMGMRVIMDMVLNHSSDEHKWFRQARKSKDNPYRNYYIWGAPKPDGSAPNNWGNYFREGDGSAWTLDEHTGEYYFHQYSAKMPDLNWEYEPLRREIDRMLHWWLDLGVDGFRLDVITRLKKTPGFPDSKKRHDPKVDRPGVVLDACMCTHVEGIHEILRELNENVFSKRDCFTVGEGAGTTWELAPDYVLPERRELDTVYHFELYHQGKVTLTPALFRTVQTHWADILDRGGWEIQYLTNHDSQRQVSFYGNDAEHRIPSAKLLAILLLTTPGTPFLYQGEEIGMTNVRFDSISDYNCRYTVGLYESMIQNGATPEEALSLAAKNSRDNARTPYQWNGETNAGFSEGKPWLRVNPNYRTVNLQKDLADPDSVFRFYQTLISLRKEHPAFLKGSLVFLGEENPDLICYERKSEEETLLVIANYSDQESAVSLPGSVTEQKWKRLLSNLPDSAPFLSDQRSLAPWEGEIYRLE